MEQNKIEIYVNIVKDLIFEKDYLLAVQARELQILRSQNAQLLAKLQNTTKEPKE